MKRFLIKFIDINYINNYIFIVLKIQAVALNKFT